MNQTRKVLALSLSCQHKLASASYQIRDAIKSIAGEYSRYCPQIKCATIVLDNLNGMRRLCNDDANKKKGY